MDVLSYEGQQGFSLAGCHEDTYVQRQALS
jgi:hypothetical protein